ncbi:MAG: hypothetical protein C0434_07325 [Xanthomonadaceae bacterium]|nr:hypothetical protein [Xanthomonadaceae bacterium]
MSEATAIPDEHLLVHLNGVLAGRLWQQRQRLVFGYDPAWLVRKSIPVLSQSLAVQAEPHEGPEVEAFFGNLLPEGDVRSAVARALRISERNDYALLDAIGGDCAGALMLSRPDAPVVEANAAGSLLSADELRRMVSDAPSRPLLTAEHGMRLSLAGAQTKFALCKAGDSWVKPAPGAISTHILKPAIRDLPGSIENEAFCMTLARRCGLGVPDCWIETDPPLYVVERYDRIRDVATGRVKRLHQEDFCQALGVPSSNKYEAEGGPSLKACFDLVRRVSSDPTGDLLRLLDWVIFNFLIGNHDAHAKNLSLIYRGGQTRLAPFYDLISTAAYPGLSEKFAMRIGGAKTVRYMSMRDWREFADDCGMTFNFVAVRLAQMLFDVGENFHALSDDFDLSDRPLSMVADVISQRNEHLGRLFEAEKTLKAPSLR